MANLVHIWIREKMRVLNGDTYTTYIPPNYKYQ